MSDVGQMGRRRFVGLGAGALGAISVGGVGYVAASCKPKPQPTAPPPPTNPARNVLRIPTSVKADGVAIEAAESTVDLGGGLSATALTYNGELPGPTLEMTRGVDASFSLVNSLDEISTIHSHGMIAPTGADGQPIHPVDPAATFDYAYPVVQRAGLSFYHPHPHLLTGKQVALGLAGGIIVRDEEELALGLVGAFHEVPLVLRDAEVKQGALAYTAKSSGFFGTTPLVNGTVDAALGADSALYRFRILNGSNARVMRLALSDGSPMHLIGNDGGLLEQAVEVTELTAAPAERFDVLVDLGGRALGDTVVLRDLDAGWDLLEIEITRVVSDTNAVPTGPLSTIEPLSAPVREREFSFDGMSKINGVSYDMARIDFTVPFGDVELWRFTTGGNAPHPVHVHGVPFQVQSRTGGRDQLYPWEAGWKDTVLLHDGETIEVLIRFDTYRGQYLIHCHQLEHEDNGMMLAFEVV